MINSHLLYQLSYRGMRRILLIEKDKSIDLCDFQQDMRGSFGTFYLVFEFSDSPFTLIVNLGSASRMAYVLSLLPPSMPLSERAQAARLPGNAAK